MKYIPFFSLLISLALACQPAQPSSDSTENEEQEAAEVHQEPTHNFTVKRLIILNDKNEILMGKEEGNWYTPSLVYNQRQFIKEALDSTANVFGITIANPKLHGYFSYKYQYHSQATLRAYYIADYVDGTLNIPSNMEAVKWMPVADAIEQTPVKSMKAITAQILNNRETIWGASFEVFRIGEEHQAKMIEDFYPLF